MNQAVETSDAPNIDRFVFGGGLLLLAGIVLAAPDVVVDIHRENIAAGAQVITANTYGVIRSDLEKVGLAAAAAQAPIPQVPAGLRCSGGPRVPPRPWGRRRRRGSRI